MIVLDTSAVVDALIARDRSPALVERLSEGASLHAPHLLDTEFVSALRHLVRRGELGEDRATDALLDFDRLPVTRYPATALVPLIWEMRHRVTAYDATFVALAQVLGCPLVTCDRALAGAGLGVDVEVF